MLGDSKFVEDEDERLWFRATGAFEGEVVPERDDETRASRSGSPDHVRRHGPVLRPHRPLRRPRRGHRRVPTPRSRPSSRMTRTGRRRPPERRSLAPARRPASSRHARSCPAGTCRRGLHRRIARAVQPGQFVHVLAPRAPGPAAAGRARGRLRPGGRHDRTLHWRTPATADALLALRPGDSGHASTGRSAAASSIDPRSRYLLVVADAAGFARVRAGRRRGRRERAAGDRAVRRALGGRGPALVAAARRGRVRRGHRRTARSVITATVTDLVLRVRGLGRPVLRGRLGAAAGTAWRRWPRAATDAWAWPAWAAAAAAGRQPVAADARRRAWLQVALSHEAGCALGVCARLRGRRARRGRCASAARDRPSPPPSCAGSRRR